MAEKARKIREHVWEQYDSEFQSNLKRLVADHEQKRHEFESDSHYRLLEQQIVSLDA